MPIFSCGLTQFFSLRKNQKDAHLKMKHHGAFVLEFGRREVPRTRVARNDPFSPPHVWYASHPACVSQPFWGCERRWRADRPTDSVGRESLISVAESRELGRFL